MIPKSEVGVHQQAVNAYLSEEALLAHTQLAKGAARTPRAIPVRGTSGAPPQHVINLRNPKPENLTNFSCTAHTAVPCRLI